MSSYNEPAALDSYYGKLNGNQYLVLSPHCLHAFQVWALYIKAKVVILFQIRTYYGKIHHDPYVGHCVNLRHKIEVYFRCFKN